MRTVPPALLFAALAFATITGLTVLAITAPNMAVALMPASVALLVAMLFYEAPILAIALLVASYGLALDVQLGVLAGAAGGLGAAVVKILPFGIAAMLALRYGLAATINPPVLVFAAIAMVSLVVLPIGRVSTTGEMVRSLIGSIAPFVIAFAAAPRAIWSTMAKAVVLVPLISVAAGLATTVVGIYPGFDHNLRLQGMHSPPFLAGFCTTAVFAATLEYLRSWKTKWLLLGGAALTVLLATQARAPIMAVGLFLLLVFFLSDRRTLPLKRKVDLVMGGLVPAAVLIGPVLVLALDRFFGDGGVNLSGRDVIWPYFVEAIERRPLFGYGLGAGKLIVNPDDPQIRLIQSNAAHNEYLRLSVDAGIIGCAAIFLSILGWVWAGTKRALPADRLVLRAAVVAVLLHSGFDNTLIASTAVIQFTWFAAALARARIEARESVPHAALRAAMERRGG
jgi:O-antigen ligase